MGVLLITNDRPPYFTDAVNVLAQYYGTLYRFRYERRVGTDLVGEIDAEKLKRAKGAVVFRNWETGKLRPIRGIRVAEATLKTDYLLVVRFYLEDFPHLGAQQHWHLMDEAVAQSGATNTPNNHMKPLIVTVEDELVDSILGPPLDRTASARSEDIDRWRDAIQSISDFSYMGRCCFLYLHTIERETGRALQIDRAAKGRLSLEAGETYTVGISQYVIHRSELSLELTEHGLGLGEALKAPIPLQMRVDKDQITPIEKKVMVVGRYDELHFVFKAHTGVSEAATVVEIGAAEPSRQHFVPTLILQIDLKYAAWQWVALVLGAVMFGVGFIYPGKAHSGLFKSLEDSGFFKLLQAAGILLVSSLGKDFHLSLFKRCVNWYRDTVASTRDL